MSKDIQSKDERHPPDVKEWVCQSGPFQELPHKAINTFLDAIELAGINYWFLNKVIVDYQTNGNSLAKLAAKSLSDEIERRRAVAIEKQKREDLGEILRAAGVAG